MEREYVEQARAFGSSLSSYAGDPASKVAAQHGELRSLVDRTQELAHGAADVASRAIEVRSKLIGPPAPEPGGVGESSKPEPSSLASELNSALRRLQSALDVARAHLSAIDQSL